MGSMEMMGSYVIQLSYMCMLQDIKNIYGFSLPRIMNPVHKYTSTHMLKMKMKPYEKMNQLNWPLEIKNLEQ